MGLRLVVSLLAVLTLIACEQRASEADPTLPSYAEPQLLMTSPVTPYSEAKSVRLFVRGEKAFDGGAEYFETGGRLLSVAQRKSLEETLKVVSYDRPPLTATTCFVPHHFIRYFDSRGQQIGQISVCLCCHEVRADPDVVGLPPAGVGDHYLDFDEAAFRQLVADMGLPTDVGC